MRQLGNMLVASLGPAEALCIGTCHEHAYVGASNDCTAPTWDGVLGVHDRTPCKQEAGMWRRGSWRVSTSGRCHRGGAIGTGWVRAAERPRGRGCVAEAWFPRVDRR